MTSLFHALFTDPFLLQDQTDSNTTIYYDAESDVECEADIHDITAHLDAESELEAEAEIQDTTVHFDADSEVENLPAPIEVVEPVVVSTDADVAINVRHLRP